MFVAGVRVGTARHLLPYESREEKNKQNKNRTASSCRSSHVLLIKRLIHFIITAEHQGLAVGGVRANEAQENWPKEGWLWLLHP